MANNNLDYLGTVVYADDPTFSGRCKIRVFGMFDELPTENIPWFVPMANNIFGAGGAGCLSVPKVGDVVRVHFNNSDKYSGEYTFLQNIDPALIDEIKDDYPDTQVLLYDSENDLIIIYQNLNGLRFYLKGSEIKIDADGTILAKHKNNTNVVELKDDTINITTVNSDNGNNNGVINIAAGSTVNISAPTVNVNSENVALGTNAINSAVKGEKLVGVLQQIRDELQTKYPQYGSALMGRTFEEILSTDVKLT